MPESKKNILVIDPDKTSQFYYKKAIEMTMSGVEVDSLSFDNFYSVENKDQEKDLIRQIREKFENTNISIIIAEPAELSEGVMDEILNINVALLAITGRARLIEIENLHKMGIEEVITKPAIPEKIINKIHSFIYEDNNSLEEDKNCSKN